MLRSSLKGRDVVLYYPKIKKLRRKHLGDQIMTSYIIKAYIASGISAAAKQYYRSIPERYFSLREFFKKRSLQRDGGNAPSLVKRKPTAGGERLPSPSIPRRYFFIRYGRIFEEGTYDVTIIGEARYPEKFMRGCRGL